MHGLAAGAGVIGAVHALPGYWPDPVGKPLLRGRLRRQRCNTQAELGGSAVTDLERQRDSKLQMRRMRGTTPRASFEFSPGGACMTA